MPGLTVEHESEFYSGNSWFNQPFVSAPATTKTRDGLGPLYNGTSCSSCHMHDGRGAPPDDGLAPLGSLLLRLSVETSDGVGPDPVYGAQLQDVAIDGYLPEASPRLTYTEVPGVYPDGTPYSLLDPTIHLEGENYGPFAPGLTTSARVAPHMVGLGLLEAIPESALAAHEDPDDVDGDGISGRRHTVVDPATGNLSMGRFGWKAESPTILAQSAGAFSGDMGVTSWVMPGDDCTEAQSDCLDATSGGLEEAEAHVLDRVVTYSRTIAVPARRAWDDPTVLRGKSVFRWAGCGDCHTPSHTTGAFAPVPELEGQRIWPYTDLLLHDMGEGLADALPTGDASGREWKTPPLWGLGLVPDVNGHTRYLHDGRARSFEEAVLWHGGEAEAAREAFMALPSDDRDALIRFLEDL
jgi:CxxC motif-containing protein (DUF1111 family)